MNKLFSFVGAAALAIGIGCSSSDSTPAAGSGASSGTNPFSKCSSGGSGGSGTMQSAACQKLDDCELAACDPTYRKCYGAAYASGTFGGACSAFISCYASSCNAVSCAAQITAECQTCTDEVSTCEKGVCAAERAACGSGGAGGGGGGGGSAGSAGSAGGGSGTCADLALCCPAVADANSKAACEMTVAGKTDSTCGVVLTQYKAAKFCP